MNRPTAERQQILALVRASIEHGLKQGAPPPVSPQNLSSSLTQPGACFVTLEIDHQLRGCIGSIEAHRSLVEDLIENSFAAAFRDPRFSPLTPEEFPNTTIKISLLTAPEPLPFDSEKDLIKKIRPGMDGLILTEKGHRGTFLPSVWEQLPDPKQFLQQLKLKAGLHANYWSKTIRIERYQTEQIS